MSHSEQTGSLTGLEVAIIGMALRFPGAASAEELWRNLRDGVESIVRFSDEALAAAGIAEAVLRDPGYVKAGAILPEIERFDAELFGYSPHEAQLVDPQQRVFLECCWEALEDAGYDPERFEAAIGVYAGVGFNSYVFNLLSNFELVETLGTLQALLGNDKDYLTTRAAYKLHLRGPAVTVQTACSSSLVATHLACQGLLTGECGMAIAGGVSIKLPQPSGYFFREGEIYSPDGRCRAFDAEARGTVFGNGVGLVVLKRLADAIRDGDTIRAVIKGSAINNDGALKVGFTAPGLEGQARVIRAAQATAEVDPATITYVEAHGTGTPLGDPIEVSALTRAFAGVDRRSYCALGSIKTNLGHLDVAAGIAGLIKTVLALQHRQIPPSLHFRNPNPEIDFAGSPFYVNADLQPWAGNGGRLRAGVSSFGIGGTNAHAILEEAPPPQPAVASRSAYLLVLSAHTPAALEAATDRLADHLERHPDLDLAEVAYTLQVGRRTLGARRVVVCRTMAEAVAALRGRTPGRVFTAAAEAGEGSVVFLFPGQGAQYPGMAAGLYAAEPAFRDTVDRCAELLSLWLGGDIRDFLRQEAEPEDPDASPLVQPALFVVEYALARLWMGWGVRPSALAGHSLGEYAAACVAGVFSLEDALRLVATRARLIQRLPHGAMLSVALSPQDLEPLLGCDLALAAVNGPSLSVVSGMQAAVEALAVTLAARGVEHHRLHTAYGFHSPLVDPILEDFRLAVEGVELNPPRIPYVSNVTGTWITTAEATDPGYWVRHLRRTVLLGKGIATLLADADPPTLLEVGPGRTLASLVRSSPQGAGRLILVSLRHLDDREDDPTFLLTSLGRLWMAGIGVGWPAFHAGERLHRVPLPTYPFERQRYWVERRKLTTAGAAEAPADMAGWLHLPSWRRSVPPDNLPPAPEGRRRCLLFSSGSSLDEALVEQLRELGHSCVTVGAGQGFERRSVDTYVLDPMQREDFGRLFQHLEQAGGSPDLVVHAWAAAPPAVDEDPLALSPWRELAFFSLLHLAQAVGETGVGRRLLLAMISTGAHSVTGEEEVRPARALVLGPCRVIPKEYPSITCRNLDVPAVGRERARPLAQQVIRDLLSTASDPVVAYRGGHRWVPAFEPVPDQPGGTAPLREDGVYLITGGTGGIALLVGEHIARTVRAHLALVGRTPLPPRERWDALADSPDPLLREQIRGLRAIEAHGTEVTTFAADVADLPQMRAVFGEVLRCHGTIAGVIHAAGTAGGGMIQWKSDEAAEAVLAPKVRGALVLAELTRDLPLDFFLICSSTIAVTGDLGQVDYCAANCFLDAFAHTLSSRRGTLVSSIGWDRWRGVGMSVAANRAVRARRIGREVRHPLLQRCLTDGPEERVFSALLEADGHWLLREHRMSGQAVLPGTAFLEMARAAFVVAGSDHAVEIHDSVFEAPLVVPAGELREVRTVLKWHGDSCTFSILSATVGSETGWSRHASGRISDGGEPLRIYRPAGPEPDPLPVGALQSELGGGGGLVTWGPHWQSLRGVRAVGGEVVGLLELPEAFHRETGDLGVHPALLDVATALGALVTGRNDYLPLAYGRVRIEAGLPPRIIVSARLRDGEEGAAAVTFDLRIADPTGLVLVELDGFILKRIERAPVAAAPAAAASEGIPPGGIPSDKGLEAIERLLRLRLGPHVIVSSQNLEEIAREASAAPRPPGDAAPAARPETAHRRPHIQTPYVEPRNELERMLAGIWQELLGIEQIGVHDNFFELGGHSLLAIRLATRLRDELGLELPISRLFRVATVAELTELIVASLSEQAEEEVLRQALDAVEEGIASVPEGSQTRSAPQTEGRGQDG